MATRPCILVLDDEPRSVEALMRILDEDFEVLTATSAAQAHAILEREWIQVLLCDQRMPETSGVEFCSLVRERWPNVVRIIISGYTDSHDIIDAVNDGGIYQYIVKPWQPDDLVLKMHNAVELFRLQRENEQLGLELRLKPDTLADAMQQKRRTLQARFDWDLGIVRSPDSSMNRVCHRIQQVAPFDVNVVIQGETGTGKELCARALHYNSLRRDAPFVAENCAALPDDLLESELFGHKRGAFTGANDDRTGLFEIASGGTVFLDEIGDISPAFQVKLLRVLQEGDIRPLGSNTRRRVDIRVLCATNRNLVDEVESGRFRQDLYYRLANFTIHIPPLRERLVDIEPLAHAILKEQITQLGKSVKGITEETIDCFRRYHWPGNVREMQNEIMRMLVLAPKNVLSADLISPSLLRASAAHAPSPTTTPSPPSAATSTASTATVTPASTPAAAAFAAGTGTLKQRLGQLEAQVLRETLVRHSWNKSRVAEELGISRVGLRSKLERHELEPLRNADELTRDEL